MADRYVQPPLLLREGQMNNNNTNDRHMFSVFAENFAEEKRVEHQEGARMVNTAKVIRNPTIMSPCIHKALPSIYSSREPAIFLAFEFGDVT